VSEYEIVYMANEYINRTWEILQVWAGISFGLIAITHFSSKYINLSVVLTASILYVAFSFFAMTIFRTNGEVVDGFLNDLVALEASGIQLSIGSQAVLSEKPGGAAMLSIIAVFFSTFFASLVFLWWSYLSGLKRKSD
jgi:hypothetical protein